MPLQTIPYEDPITDRETGRITRLWTRWLSLLVGRVNDAPERLGTSSIGAQTGTTGITSFGNAALQAGVYRLAYYIHVVSPSTDAGDTLGVRFSWVDGGDSLVFDFAPFSVEATPTGISASSGIIHVRVDPSALVAYEITLTGTGTGLNYAADLTIESVSV